MKLLFPKQNYTVLSPSSYIHVSVEMYCIVYLQRFRRWWYECSNNRHQHDLGQKNANSMRLLHFYKVIQCAVCIYPDL
jgi:hypothetical protein